MAPVRKAYGLKSNDRVFGLTTNLSRRIEAEVKKRTDDKVTSTILSPYADCHWTIAVFWNTGPGQIAYHALPVEPEEIEHQDKLIERIAKEAVERYEAAS